LVLVPGTICRVGHHRKRAERAGRERGQRAPQSAGKS